MGTPMYCCLPGQNQQTASDYSKKKTVKVPEEETVIDNTVTLQKLIINEDDKPPRIIPAKSHSNNFLLTKLNNIKVNQNQGNRRKSFSIAINPDHLAHQNNINTIAITTTNQDYTKGRTRSKSTFGIELPEDITDTFQMKKAYKNLPNQNKSHNDIHKPRPSLVKTASIVSEDNGIIQSPEHKRRKPIENINKPFTKKQLEVIKKILLEEELIEDEMDDSTINMIINTINYIRVKPGVVIFTKENKNDHIYYMIDKGKLEYTIDGTKYELERHGGIGTRALDKNSEQSCSLEAIERCYLYCLPIEKYKTIAQDFVDRQKEEKIACLKNHFFFKNLNKDLIEKLAQHAVKIKYNQRTVIYQEESHTNSIYYIVEGQAICTKGELIILKLSQGNIFGELGLFNPIESYYSYSAETDTVLLKIDYEDILGIFGHKVLKTIIFAIFCSAIKSNEMLNKYLSGDNLEKIFEKFELRFYFNDTVMTPHQKKLILPISGMLFKSVHQGKDMPNLAQKINNMADESLSIEKGSMFIESIILDTPMSYNIVSDECVVYEGKWVETLKVLPKASDSDLFICQKINLIRNHPLFKYLADFKVFQLANTISIQSYKAGQVILKDGPSSDRFYIIKQGSVSIQMQKQNVKTLEVNHTFGDISSQVGEYTRKADFIAVGRVDCYYIEKEVYDDIVDKDNLLLKPLKKMLMMKDITISLEGLYFLKDLGVGSYGKVYLVHDMKRFYAMKTAEIQILCQKQSMAQSYLSEKSIMFSIEHPFIIQLINTFKTREYILFLMEYADGRSLRDHINKKQKDSLRNLEEVQFFGAILACALNYLQKQRIIHRDLKPENLMIDQHGYLKLIDFGVAKDLASRDYAHTFIGTHHYMAPEMILDKGYNFSVDYWAMGIILYESFYGRTPFGFNAKDPNSVLKEITEKKLIFPSDIRNETFNSFVKLLLNKNPTKRINSYQKIKSNPFFTGYDFDGLLEFKTKSPIYTDGQSKSKDLNNVDIPFIHFMRNNIYASSTELDELLKKNGDDFLSDF